MLNTRMKNLHKLKCLKEIEQFLFKDLKNQIVIDFNAKVLINHSLNTQNVSKIKAKF